MLHQHPWRTASLLLCLQPLERTSPCPASRGCVTCGHHSSQPVLGKSPGGSSGVRSHLLLSPLQHLRAQLGALDQPLLLLAPLQLPGGEHCHQLQDLQLRVSLQAARSRLGHPHVNGSADPPCPSPTGLSAQTTCHPLPGLCSSPSLRQEQSHGERDLARRHHSYLRA